MSEPIKIEPYYQAQAKQLVDCLFDKGLLSETLNRDGMEAIEELLAFYLQTGADTAARCAGMTKKYKQISKAGDGEDPVRSEEEMRWIARAKEAEARVVGLEFLCSREEKADWKWGQEVGTFLKDVLTKMICREEMQEASRLFTDGIALGIIPEPDCRPGPIKVA